MKILTVLLFSLCILVNLIPGVQKSSNSGKTIILQSEVKNPDPGLMKQSAGIISSRLKMYGIKSFDVKVAGPEQIDIDVHESYDPSALQGLLTSAGEIAFYETLIQSEIAGLCQDDHEIYTLLNRKTVAGSSDPRIGCSGEKQKVESHIKSLPLKNYKFLWGNESVGSGYCLFALKVSSDGLPLLKGSDIESAGFTDSQNSGGRTIRIKLKPEAVNVFAEATRKNLDRSIAIVIDDKVYSWPVVKSAIEKGEVEVTGDFTEKEIKYFPVIFSCGKLPLNFKLIQ